MGEYLSEKGKKEIIGYEDMQKKDVDYRKMQIMMSSNKGSEDYKGEVL